MLPLPTCRRASGTFQRVPSYRVLAFRALSGSFCWSHGPGAPFCSAAVMLQPSGRGPACTVHCSAVAGGCGHRAGRVTGGRGGCGGRGGGGGGGWGGGGGGRWRADLHGGGAPAQGALQRGVGRQRQGLV